MKLFKKTFSLLAVAALCLGFFFSNSVTASAAEPVTWYVKYLDSVSEWRAQEGTWSDTVSHVGLSYATERLKDGDTLSLGKHNLNFCLAPMVHWPEVMMTIHHTS